MQLPNKLTSRFTKLIKGSLDPNLSKKQYIYVLEIRPCFVSIHVTTDDD